MILLFAYFYIVILKPVGYNYSQQIADYKDGMSYEKDDYQQEFIS